MGIKIALLLIIMGLTSACTVQLKAPEKPITINLNVTVEHELELQVSNDVNELFDDNPDLF